MQEPQFYDLGAQGLEWARKSLKSGKQLSHGVLTELKLESGVVSVITATKQQEEAASKGAELSHATSNEAKVRSNIPAGSLLEYLKGQDKDGRLVIVVEDDLAKAADPVIKKKPRTEYAVYDQSVMHHQKLGGITSGLELEKFLGESASGYPLNAFVVSQNLLPGSGVLTEASLQELTTGVRCIINSAYDAETYTIWRSNTL